jgi:hypothetical protein
MPIVEHCQGDTVLKSLNFSKPNIGCPEALMVARMGLLTFWRVVDGVPRRAIKTTHVIPDMVRVIIKNGNVACWSLADEVASCRAHGGESRSRWLSNT